MPGWMVTRVRAGCAFFVAALAGCLLSACGGVSVSGSGGSGSSGGATAPPSISAQPQNATVSAGQSASFSVLASASAPLSYQWRRNGSDIANATQSSYLIANAQPADSGAQFAV